MEDFEEIPHVLYTVRGSPSQIKNQKTKEEKKTPTLEGFEEMPHVDHLFPIDLWNMFNRTDEKLPGTNNSIEGWHRGFKSNFLEVFRSASKGGEHCTSRNFAKSRRTPATASKTQIRRLQRPHSSNDYSNRQRIDYLRHIAHNL